MNMLDMVKKKVVWMYFVFATLWVTFTDYFIYQYVRDNKVLQHIQTVKGWVFVVITAVLIYIILKKHEEYLKVEEKENQLSTLINAMPDYICFKDGQGRWLRVNDFGRKLYQLENVDYVGKTDVELGKYSPFFKEAFAYCEKSDEDAWREGKLTRSEESLSLPNGEIKTFDVIKVPLFTESGKRKGLVAIGRDITALKAAEAMLLKKEKLSVVGELAAGIAHEIRNPLTSIKGFIQLMKDMEKPPKKHYEILLSEIDRINQIVSELLVFAKPQSKVYKIFQLNEVLDYVINLTSHEAALSNTTFEIKKNVNPRIFGDKHQLIQVFINILKNALDAMPKGGKIQVETFLSSNTKVTVRITDTGVGIPKERLKKIGEPFFTLKEKGMGLGLTMSNKIIYEHKGSLHIDSEVGKGTTVEVTMPIYTEQKSC
jgi:two-component system, sporulation sensor kinase A